jgi:hypothetical protein
MKLPKLVVIGVLGLGLAGSTAAVAQSSNSDEFMSTADAIAKVKAAKTSSDAVTAYADAVRAVGDGVGVKQAFIVRMIDLGSPELAENQARDLVDLTADPMSSAVLAYAAARRNELDPAISNLAKAVNRNATNSFIVNTAGQILAWYDVKTAVESNAKVSEATRTAVEDIRSTVGRRSEYTRAYGDLMSQMIPPSDQGSGAAGTRIHVVNGDLDEVTTYGGSAEESRLSPLALFFVSPYGALPPNFGYGFGYDPGYGYGYGAYGGYANGYYRPIPPADYYYYDYWNRGAGPLFPFPGISRDTRYLRLPGGSAFALINNGNPTIYQSLNPWYDGRYANVYAYPRPYYRGHNGGRDRGHFGGFNGNFRRQQGGIITNGLPGAPFSALGPSRLSQRMRGNDPISNAPLYNVTAPYGGAVVPMRPPGNRPFFGR